MQIIPLLVPLTYVVALVVERLVPARPLPHVRGWLVKGILFFVMAGVVTNATPLLVHALLGDVRLFDLSGLGLVGGMLVGIVATDLVGYARHRATHSFTPLWRWTHQLHHSAERVDVAGFSYTHPLDLALGFAVTTAVSTLIGVPPDAAALAGYLLFALSVVAHLNVRTPVWLGYLIQRPEAHSLHHARGIHGHNYATLPIIDMVFDTFQNPRDFVDEAGFYPGASARVGAMLVGRDVTSPVSRHATTSRFRTSPLVR
jgi:sterol desaturase/sphingolipid hydroxylase (fatty acid hydroxylase superfamily)